jgi:2-phospho-L-lactate guanylyltransferase
MFEHVLGVAARCRGVGEIVVATDSDEVAAALWERDRGARVVRDLPGSGLGAVIDRALAEISGEAAIVLMSDLPALQARDLETIAGGLAAADVVLSPDHRDEGTNALGIVMSRRFETRFGHSDSFRRHLSAARELCLRVEVARSPGLTLDVDLPEDLSLHSVRTIRNPI